MSKAHGKDVLVRGRAGIFGDWLPWRGQTHTRRPRHRTRPVSRQTVSIPPRGCPVRGPARQAGCARGRSGRGLGLPCRRAVHWGVTGVTHRWTWSRPSMPRLRLRAVRHVRDDRVPRFTGPMPATSRAPRHIERRHCDHRTRPSIRAAPPNRGLGQAFIANRPRVFWRPRVGSFGWWPTGTCPMRPRWIRVISDSVTEIAGQHSGRSKICSRNAENAPAEATCI